MYINLVQLYSRYNHSTQHSMSLVWHCSPWSEDGMCLNVKIVNTSRASIGDRPLFFEPVKDHCWRTSIRYSLDIAFAVNKVCKYISICMVYHKSLVCGLNTTVPKITLLIMANHSNIEHL